MRSLYPDIEPYSTHLLEMEILNQGHQHKVYVEECGNPDGIPVVFLHGGPGSGCRPQHRCYFNPEKYRIILLDQRGCGRSTPLGELENNTTAYLIQDLETIRQQLNIDKWVLFGGSWGATLALCYAINHADKVLAMILRGTFLGRQRDIDWVYADGGASKLFPDAWQQLTASVPDADKTTPLANYFARLQANDEEIRMAAAKTLNDWEATIVTLRDYEFVPETDPSPGPLAHSQVQLHYALNACFIADQAILDNIDNIRSIPTQVIHGRYDIVCPLQQSWQLKQQWPEIKLTIVPLAGHAAGEPAIVDALVSATDTLLDQL